tara:strand:- start:6 stop:230 length:225 start_codon:yes stop_codon:yes gene_type:complete
MWSSETKGFVKTASKISQDNYPEMMGKMFIINSGTTFTAVWSIVKGWIDEKTRNKIEVLGGSYMTKLEAFVDLN